MIAASEALLVDDANLRGAFNALSDGEQEQITRASRDENDLSRLSSDAIDDTAEAVEDAIDAVVDEPSVENIEDAIEALEDYIEAMEDWRDGLIGLKDIIDWIAGPGNGGRSDISIGRPIARAISRTAGLRNSISGSTTL